MSSFGPSYHDVVESVRNWPSGFRIVLEIYDKLR